ncbi:MAG: hypothetical protein AAGB11_02125 [Pseudomonadota bacterium]
MRRNEPALSFQAGEGFFCCLNEALASFFVPAVERGLGIANHQIDTPQWRVQVVVLIAYSKLLLLVEAEKLSMRRRNTLLARVGHVGPLSLRD